MAPSIPLTFQQTFAQTISVWLLWEPRWEDVSVAHSWCFAVSVLESATSLSSRSGPFTWQMWAFSAALWFTLCYATGIQRVMAKRSSCPSSVSDVQQRLPWPCDSDMFNVFKTQRCFMPGYVKESFLQSFFISFNSCNCNCCTPRLVRLCHWSYVSHQTLKAKWKEFNESAVYLKLWTTFLAMSDGKEEKLKKKSYVQCVCCFLFTLNRFQTTDWLPMIMSEYKHEGKRLKRLSLHNTATCVIFSARSF